MSKPSAVWINANPSFKKFDRPLVEYFAQKNSISIWEYCQSPDEPCSLNIALSMLHSYLKKLSYPVHLVGHGVGGLLGLLYAETYPQKVRSLTLLGVGVYPSINWQAHYYTLLKVLRCSRDMILAQMVNHLFGEQSRKNIRRLIDVLERDLSSSPSPTSLFNFDDLWARGVSMPLMVCGSRNDIVIDPDALHGWKSYLKEGDRLWECPQGRHFFHYFYPLEVGEQIIYFWRSVTQISETNLRVTT